VIRPQGPRANVPLEVLEELDDPGILMADCPFAEGTVAAMTAAAGGAFPHFMPFHIDDHHVDGKLTLTELVAQGEELVVRVRPVLAPPVAEDELRGQRDAAGDFGIIGQSGLVVVSVGEKIEVLDII